jgi:hypothetical protein
MRISIYTATNGSEAFAKLLHYRRDFDLLRLGAQKQHLRAGPQPDVARRAVRVRLRTGTGRQHLHFKPFCRCLRQSTV